MALEEQRKLEQVDGRLSKFEMTLKPPRHRDEIWWSLCRVTYVLSYENGIEEKSNILLILPVPYVEGFSGLCLKPGKIHLPLFMEICSWNICRKQANWKYYIPVFLSKWLLSSTCRTLLSLCSVSVVQWLTIIPYCSHVSPETLFILA